MGKTADCILYYVTTNNNNKVLASTTKIKSPQKPLSTKDIIILSLSLSNFYLILINFNGVEIPS